MNISRRSARAGLRCTTCHRTRNGRRGAPPGVAHWRMPPAETPMVFEGKTVRELCRQLASPERNGGRELGDLLVHIRDDALVKWGWKPGPGRSRPPLSHRELVARVKIWVAAGGPCP